MSEEALAPRLWIRINSSAEKQSWATGSQTHLIKAPLEERQMHFKLHVMLLRHMDGHHLIHLSASAVLLTWSQLVFLSFLLHSPRWS